MLEIFKSNKSELQARLEQFNNNEQHLAMSILGIDREDLTKLHTMKYGSATEKIELLFPNKGNFHDYILMLRAAKVDGRFNSLKDKSFAELYEEYKTLSLERCIDQEDNDGIMRIIAVVIHVHLLFLLGKEENDLISARDALRGQ